MISWAQVKKSLIPQLLISYTFLVSGLIVNFLELMTLIFIWPFNRRLYDIINYYLALMMWGNLTALAQWWSGSDFDFYCSEETLKNIGKENAISVLNHKYEIDWLFGWVLCQRVGLLGGSKVFNKSATKYLPIVGWSFWFKNMLFLNREWASDQKSLAVGINRILDTPKEIPFNLGILSEGTRFTDAKHAASMEVATAKGLPHLKHHLLPRTKGFTLLCTTINNKVNWLYDITLAIPKVNGTEKPSLKLIKDGVPIPFQIYLRRIPLSSVPLEEKASADWLQKLYQEKDAIFDIFDKTGSFGETEEIKKHYVKKNKYDLYVALMWMVVIAVPSVYYLLQFLVNGAWIAKLSLIGGFALVNFAVKYLISSTDSNKASSQGLKKKE